VTQSLSPREWRTAANYYVQAKPLLINPVCTKDPTKPEINRDRVIKVQENDEGGDLNYITDHICKAFCPAAETSHEVLFTYTLDGEIDLLSKLCVVKTWDEMKTNVIFARDRPMPIQSSDGMSTARHLPVTAC
jgi:hypothetical protein